MTNNDDIFDSHWWIEWDDEEPEEDFELEELEDTLAVLVQGEGHHEIT